MVPCHFHTPAQVPVSIVAVAEGTTRIPGARAQGKRTISLGTACCEVVPSGTCSAGTLLLLLTCYNTAVQQAVPVDVVPWLPRTAVLLYVPVTMVPSAMPMSGQEELPLIVLIVAGYGTVAHTPFVVSSMCFPVLPKIYERGENSRAAAVAPASVSITIHCRCP